MPIARAALGESAALFFYYQYHLFYDTLHNITHKKFCLFIFDALSIYTAKLHQQ